MKHLTKEMILSDTRWKLRLFFHYIFFVSGIIASFAPIIYFRNLSFNSIFGSVFMLLVFGSTFGYYFGLKHILEIYKTTKKIKNNKFFVVEDIAVGKELTSDDGFDVAPDNYCYLEFKDYSRREEINYSVSRYVYEKTENGDKFYLVFVEGKKEPINIYSLKEYIYEGAKK